MPLTNSVVTIKDHVLDYTQDAQYFGSTPPGGSEGLYWRPHANDWHMLATFFHERAERQRHRPDAYGSSSAEIQHYQVPLCRAFESAAKEYPAISVDDSVMAGAPCIVNTRIPVYMILDAIEHYGEVAMASRSYPNLTLEQIKDAIGFAKLVVECQIDERSSPIA